jgi:hypothetical protein
LHLRCIKYKWQFAIIDLGDYQAIFPIGLFYAQRAILREAIFVIDKLDTLGVGPKLHQERKPADDYFLFLHLVLLIKLNPQGLSGVSTNDL